MPDRRPDHAPPVDADTLPDGALAAVDAIAASFQRREGQPGLAYGVVAGGALVHARGLGQRWPGGPAPDAGTVFRIASMTKSFTAAAVLALRDDGALALDDPAQDYVAELRGLRPATADSPRISLRQLLTMTAGLPTDDPWGDRQQGLPLPEFSDLLAGGLSFAWSPGTRFEYANLGYALLGAVITAVSGTAYPDFVAERLLGPLGLSRTGYDAAEFTSAELARGYRRSGEGWTEIAPDGCGAFAPMGGVFSCVRDLARWVAGFAAAFPPGAETTGGPHPLRRATRREMQLPQVALPARGPVRLPGQPGGAGPGSYGFGLFVEEDPIHGRVVQHSGGYPGFGSHMRWHPDTGIGLIVLANSTYAGAHSLGQKLLDAVLGQLRPEAGRPAAGARPPVIGLAPAPGGPWPETVAARQEVTRLLRSWDDAAADRLFTENVAQDEPYAERRQKIERLRQRLGDLIDDQARPAEFDSPAHCRWWLRGEHGGAAVEIRLTPERHPRVQQLVLAVPPDPDSALWHRIEALISLLNDGAAQWPPDLPVSAAVDTGLLLRQLRMAAAWAGHCRPGRFRGGNGETSAVLQLDGETGALTLTAAIDPAGHSLQQADIMLGH